MSMLGYRTAEPRERDPEKSSVWQKVLELLWKDGITKSHIAKELHLPIDEIEALIGPLVSIDIDKNSMEFKNYRWFVKYMFANSEMYSLIV